MARSRNVPTVIEAEQFILRDGDGRIRATIKLKQGGPALELFDIQGQPRITVRLDKSGHAMIRLESSKGASLSLDVDDDGKTGLFIKRQGGIPTFSVSCDSDEDLQIIVYDKDGNAVQNPFDPRQHSTSK